MMHTYPEKALRGISSKEFLAEDGTAKHTLFQFSKNPREIDGYYDLSINWLDDDGAIAVVMDQKKNDGDEVQFKAGAVVIQRDYLDDLKCRPNSSEELFYERRSLPNNRYHGNIVCKTQNKERQSLFRAGLAMCVVDIIERSGM